MAKGRKAGRGGRKGVKRAVKRAMKRMGNSEIANLKQTITFKANVLTANTLYGLYNYSLSTCDRAVQVGKAYQFYRITKIELLVKPSVDTFTQAAGQSVPYLYYLIDKAGNFSNSASVSFNSMRDAGAKPLRFDDKTKRIVWKPAVLLNANDQGNVGNAYAQYKTSPWLCTNANNLNVSAVWAPNSTDHFGCLIGVEQDSGTACKYDIDMVVHYQFKKPRVFETGAAIPFVRPDLDDPALAVPTPGYVAGLLDV